MPNGRTTKNKQEVINAICYTFGSLLSAVAINVFSAPNNIAPGGVSGLATVVHYVVPAVPIGVAILAMNLPLMVASWRYGGRSFTVRTAICTLMMSVAVDITAPFLPAYRGDPMLAAVFGGVALGAGLGLIYMRGASTGGSEIVARLWERRMPTVSIGRLILLIDAAVVAAAAVVFRKVDSAMYAVVMIFVSSRLMDALIYGGIAGKLVMIVSERQEEIADAILSELHRGVTKLNASGAYSGEQRPVLLCAVLRTQLYSLRRLVAERDPAAFLIVTATDEVLGKGFRPVIEKK